MENESESNQPLTSSSPSPCNSHDPIPKDDRLLYNTGYTIFFNLGAEFLLPWNCLFRKRMHAVDYFQDLVPQLTHRPSVLSRIHDPVSRVLASPHHFVADIACPRDICWIHTGISTILVIFVLMLIMDRWGLDHRRQEHQNHSLTDVASTILGVADALVQAAELPERYMQASVAGTSAAGLQFVSSFVICFFCFSFCDWIWLRLLQFIFLKFVCLFVLKRLSNIITTIWSMLTGS